MSTLQYKQLPDPEVLIAWQVPTSRLPMGRMLDKQHSVSAQSAPVEQGWPTDDPTWTWDDGWQVPAM